MSLVRFRKIIVDNFFNIKHAEFDFENQGLVGILGKNGSGKSALMVEAPCYALFGLTERYGKSRDKIVNRFVGKDCHISQSLLVGEDLIEIDAYRRHHKYKDNIYLKINGEDKRGNSNDQTWDRILKIIDMDYLAFTNSVVFGQSLSQYFSGLSDSSQKEIVEKLLGITWIPKVYEIAKEDKDNCCRKIENETNKLGNLEQNLNQLNDKLNEYEVMKTEFEREKKERAKELEKEFQKIKDCSSLENKIGKLVLDLKSVENELEKVEGRNRSLEKERVKFETEILGLKKEGNKVGKLLVNVCDLKIGTICESCGSEITEKTKGNYEEHLKTDKEKYLEEIKEVQSKLDQLSVSENKLNKNEEILRSKNLGLKNESEKLKLELIEVNKENARIEERNNSLKEIIRNLKESKNVYADLVDKLAMEISGVKSTLEKVKGSYNGLLDEFEYHKFWEEGYSNRGLKSFVIEASIPEMDRFAKLYSEIFGGKYDISFSAQKTLKSGELREKFNVYVSNKFGAESYEGNSKGEKGAIDAIVMFVLGDLAANRSNKRFSMLILDDVFEKLDETICESVIKVLNSMVLGTEGLPKRESIFVLTHLEAFKSRFENRVLFSSNQGETIIN